MSRRARKSAIIISSDESGNDSDHSDFSPEALEPKNKKKIRISSDESDHSDYSPVKTKPKTTNRKRKVDDGEKETKPKKAKPNKDSSGISEVDKLNTDVEAKSKPKATLKAEKPASKDKKEKPIKTEKEEKPIKTEKEEKPIKTEKEEKPIKTEKEEKPIKTEKAPAKAKKEKPTPAVTNEDQFWVPADVIAAEQRIEHSVASTVVRLLEEGNSLPFLARYRREATGGMGPDTLRQVKDMLDSLREVQEKCKKVVAAVEKVGKMNPVLKSTFMRAQSLAELDHLHAPYKTGSKASLAERARKLGLEEVAVEVMEGRKMGWDLSSLVAKGVKGKETVDEVKIGIQHILADMIVHDPPTADEIRNLQNRANIVVESKKAKVAKSDAKDPKKQAKEEDIGKFENYFEFTCPAKYIKPHQVLALNRGENLKVLSVKVNVPDWFLQQLEGHVNRHWRLQNGSRQRGEMISASLADAYKRLVVPLVQRQMRALLTKNAEDASISVFLENLRRLLLTPPYRGKGVLAVDPGFSHGCKVAVLSPSGDMVEHAVIYPNFRAEEVVPDNPAVRKLIELVRKHQVPTIAIGNGTACREVETMVSSLISGGMIGPNSRVNYTIVDEQGASIYSCSPVAATEFPGLDTNIVSAVSIGRRLQDPLSEFVKIEPQHLGVGMYQHDLAQARLKLALDEVVVECVSFVGVDVNSCSQHLLNRVAGLNSARAKAIVEWRQKNGDFLTRDQLKKVKGVGDKVFQQCAGFVRVVPRAGGADKAGRNLLDMTQVHPESYKVAQGVVKQAGVRLEQLGTEEFIKGLKRFVDKVVSMEKLAGELGVGLPTLEMILQALQQRLDYDIRAEFSAPLFKSGMTKLEDVKPGDVLTGRVTNVTHFGAFVDVGLGRAGLVHTSKMWRHKLELGQRVEVKVEKIELSKGRIGLELIKLL